MTIQQPSPAPGHTNDLGPRPGSAAGSAPSAQNRRQHSTQISTIETSVTHLLVATKQLLEVLTKWSTNKADENAVSDVYVRLGYEFNIACRAFNKIGVDTSDLGDVPELLRTILEKTLSQTASAASLENYLPRIRDIIINLLHGLKGKQQTLRLQHARRDTQGGSAAPGIRHSSTGSVPPAESSGMATPSQVDGPSRTGWKTASQGDPHTPTDRSSIPSGIDAEISPDAGSPHYSVGPSQAIAGPNTSTTPYPSANTIPAPSFRSSRSGDHHPAGAGYPNGDQSQSAALMDLQGAMQRRASRRTTYLSPYNGINSYAAPASKSPAPNRGRDSVAPNMMMQKSVFHHRQESAQRLTGTFKPGGSPAREGSPPYQFDTPAAGPTDSTGIESRRLSLYVKPGRRSGMIASSRMLNGQVGINDHSAQTTTQSMAARQTPASPVPEKKEATLYLKYKRRLKKYVLEDGLAGLSLAGLELAFIEKFAWNTHHPGAEFPAIYIEENGVAYELEDLSDVKDKSVLSLNVDELDEVKKSISDTIHGLQAAVEGVKTSLDSQQAVIRRVSEAQQAMSVEIASLATAPRPASSSSSTAASTPLTTAKTAAGGPAIKSSAAQLREVQELKRDVSLLQQACTGAFSEFESTIGTITTKTEALKEIANQSVAAQYNANGIPELWDFGRDCEAFVLEVDELHNNMDKLAGDVLTHRVRPAPHQLDTLQMGILNANNTLREIKQRIGKNKAPWMKLWENALVMIYNERTKLTDLEDLAASLEEDLSEATTIHDNICKVAEHLNDFARGAPKIVPTIPIVKLRPTGSSTALSNIKNSVLDELRALTPDHDSRVKAIEEAQRQRANDLRQQEKSHPFKKELTDFVDKGKFKTKGGFELLEKVRLEKESSALKGIWEAEYGDGDDDDDDDDGDDGDGNDNDNDNDNAKEAENGDGDVPDSTVPSTGSETTLPESEPGSAQVSMPLPLGQVEGAVGGGGGMSSSEDGLPKSATRSSASSPLSPVSDNTPIAAETPTGRSSSDGIFSDATDASHDNNASGLGLKDPVDDQWSSLRRGSGVLGQQDSNSHQEPANRGSVSQS